MIDIFVQQRVLKCEMHITTQSIFAPVPTITYTKNQAKNVTKLMATFDLHV